MASTILYSGTSAALTRGQCQRCAHVLTATRRALHRRDDAVHLISSRGRIAQLQRWPDWVANCGRGQGKVSRPRKLGSARHHHGAGLISRYATLCRATRPLAAGEQLNQSRSVSHRYHQTSQTSREDGDGYHHRCGQNDGIVRHITGAPEGATCAGGARRGQIEELL